MWWLSILETLAVAAACTAVSLRYLHMLQLESYQLPGYKRVLRTRPGMQTGPTLWAGIGLTALYFVASFLCSAIWRGNGRAIAAHCVAIAAMAGFVFSRERARLAAKEKKPLVFTPRMRRLTCACAGIVLLAAGLLVAIGLPAYILLAAVPWLPVAGAAVMAPWERRVNEGFFRDAQATLAARPDLIRVGITGSFGKTSTKVILASILSEKYCVLASPASFNTPMGLTRVIREQLEPRHQVFIAEMGARHRGDIRELTELVRPQYGLLTTVGAQHLETFGDMETVARTKYELIEGLEEGGAAFFVSDGGIVDSLYNKARCDKVLVCREGEPHGCWAKDIESGPSGSRFTLVLDGAELPVTTALLGAHNIRNICLACAAAHRLGLTDAQIMRGVSRLRPVEHRLQLLPASGGIAVIDDAFNANPVGAAEALRVLSAFPGRHIVVTPGFVEEGGMEVPMNRRLGEQIAAACHVAILVGGRHAEPIAEGARAAGMPAEAIHTVPDLTAAQALLAQLARQGDTVLFENDLPDNYDGV